MLYIHEMMIDRFVEELQESYRQSFHIVEPQFPNIIEWISRLALENIANTDNLYHDLEHTILVTSAGQAIIKGKHLSEGGVSSRDWLNFTIALLFHDIGYVRGVCRADKTGTFATGIGDETVKLSEEYSDSVLTPYHVDRSKLFILERFNSEPLVDLIDSTWITNLIERTRFPIPKSPEYQQTDDFPGLLRGADFIGQLGDPNYLQKIPALYYEFEDNGVYEQNQYQNPGQMRREYTQFFWDVVFPYIGDAIRFLNITQEGKQWVANLYAHVHRMEHY